MVTALETRRIMEPDGSGATRQELAGSFPHVLQYEKQLNVSLKFVIGIKTGIKQEFTDNHIIKTKPKTNILLTLFQRRA